MKNKLICFITLLVTFTLTAAQRPASPLPPQISEAEMKQMEAEIAEFQKEIESLSPDEQASFFKSMEEAVKKIDDLSKTDEGKALLDKLDKGSISDEELDQLINQIVGQEEENSAAPSPAEQPKEEPKPAPKPKQILSSKHEQAIDTINAIIAYSNAFIVKAATVPELPGKITKWQKHTLMDWKPGLTWSKLKTDIEQLVSHLNMVIERDHKTKEYYHIDELLKAESLYNNLKKILHTLSEYEPKIEEISPLHRNLTKTSKQAFQKILSQYSEALYTLNVIEELKKLVAKFHPKAKVAREEEEKALQKAEVEKNKKLMPGSPITVGSPEIAYAPRSSKRSPDSAAPTPSHPVYFPSSIAPIEHGVTTGTTPQGKSKGKKGTDSTKEDKDTEEEEDKKEDGKDTKKEEKDDKLGVLKKHAEKLEKKDARVFKEADKIVDKISDNMKSLADSIAKTKFFAQLDTHIADSSDINFEFVTETMPELMRELSMRRGILGNITQLHDKLKTPAARKKYQEVLQKLFEKYKNTLEMVVNQLTTIESNWATVATTISPSKHYAYFAQEKELAEPAMSEEEIDKKLEEIEAQSSSVEEGLEKAVVYLHEKKQPADIKLDEARRKIPTPVSLFELKKNIIMLRDMITNFDQPMLPK